MMRGDFAACEICGGCGVEPPTDRFRRGYLEDSGRADCIFMVLKADPAA